MTLFLRALVNGAWSSNWRLAQKSSPGLTSVCFERVAFCEFVQILPGIVAGHRTPRLANLEGIVGEFWLSVQLQERWTYSRALKSTAPRFGRYTSPPVRIGCLQNPRYRKGVELIKFERCTLVVVVPPALMTLMPLRWLAIHDALNAQWYCVRLCIIF